MRAARGKARAFKQLSALSLWVRARPGRRGIARRADYCALERDGLEVDFTVNNDLVVFRTGKAASPARFSGTPMATFDATARGGGRVDLVGVNMPATARVGQRFTMELLWRVWKPPPAWWKVFVHFDSSTTRFHADHVPAVCGVPKSLATGLLVRDRFDVEVVATRAHRGEYKVYTGWWRGYHRAAASSAALQVKDNRLLLGTVKIKPRSREGKAAHSER